ncbi:MBOAT family O-acyltransferase [Haploplasma axanthum]|uniref:D-alanyl-lipoteichoic acid biosynthesis protein DltB n=1 Tax=Haploplasma axanthum TaxID=29552 RepID=A0A449BE51_HAPAX|nr:MBOAT family O-acyltransferase [Haploplasma axanthum]VEU80731.1 D-alanyl-lipoteichoic acid biosynthesis protein DltB [Haploplasma axanthum]
MNEVLLIYGIVLLISVIAYYLIPLKYRYIVLLVFSLAFSIIVSKILILFLIGTATTIYLGARLIKKNIDTYKEKEEITQEEKNRVKKINKRIVTIVVIVNIFILGFLKYYLFFRGNFNGLFSILGTSFRLPYLKLLLPIGISFYTLQGIGYVVDVYREKYEAQKSFLKVLLFVSFFPSILEGPISRYDQVSDSLFNGNKANYQRIMLGLQRLIWGLFKKLIVADRVYLLVKTVGDNPREYSGIASLLFIIGYTIQLYADFSGFMDIALGSAELFGVKLPENFKQPFFSKSVQEFWRRWHITLGTWLKDYVFYPIALSPKINKLASKIRKKWKNHFTKMLPTIIALFVLWICNGLWHGPEWKYIFYGIYYFILIFLGMMMEPIFRKVHKKLNINTKAIWYRVFQIIRTLILVNIGMTIFGAKNLNDAFYILTSVFKPYNGSIFALGLDGYEFVILLIGVGLIFIMSYFNEKNINLFNVIASKPIYYRWVIYQAVIIFMVIFGAYGDDYAKVPFIYAEF